MKAAIFYGVGDLRLEDAEKPKVGEGEVIIKVGAAAICGTDLRIYNYGHSRLPEGQKRILGHELAGEVVEVGNKVKGIAPGMRVFVAPNIGCGRCEFCLQGRFNLCPEYEAIGLTMDGGFAEYASIPTTAINQGALLQIPDSMSFEEACLLEPLACVYNGFEKHNIKPGEAVVIVGAGPIGIMHLMISKFAGASKIIISDLSEERLKLAKVIGADVIVNPEENDLVRIVMKETDSRGADVIIIACPSPKAQETACDMAAINARINFFGGLPHDKETIRLNSNNIHYKELTILGSHGSCTYHCKICLDLVARKKINLHQLATNRYQLSEIHRAFEDTMKGIGMKSIIYPNGIGN